MNDISFRKAIFLCLVGIMGLSGYQGKSKNDDLVRAKLTLKQIFRLYDAGHDHLLNETYPNKSDNKVSYLTGDKAYLEEAQHIAKSTIDFFTEEYLTVEGKKIKLFKNTGTWFNSILFRGYTELYKLDGNNQYITIFRDNMNQVWNHARNKDGLFSKDWKGQKEDEYKSLLDQSGLVEIWAVLARR